LRSCSLALALVDERSHVADFVGCAAEFRAYRSVRCHWGLPRGHEFAGRFAFGCSRSAAIRGVLLSYSPRRLLCELPRYSFGWRNTAFHRAYRKCNVSIRACAIAMCAMTRLAGRADLLATRANQRPARLGPRPGPTAIPGLGLLAPCCHQSLTRRESAARWPGFRGGLISFKRHGQASVPMTRRVRARP
jgi:hypothetical protein